MMRGIWIAESAILGLTLVDLEPIARHELHTTDETRICRRLYIYTMAICSFVCFFGRERFLCFLKEDRRRAVLAAAHTFDCQTLEEAFGLDLRAIRRELHGIFSVREDTPELLMYYQLLAFLAHWALGDFDYTNARPFFEYGIESIKLTLTQFTIEERRLQYALGIGAKHFNPMAHSKLGVSAHG